MKLRYYYSSDQDPFDTPANLGLGKVEALFNRLIEEDVKIERLDMAGMDKDECFELYSKHAVIPSVWNRYAIRQVFGTRRRGGVFFGREVPALVVFSNGDLSPVDVYPHQEGGDIVTILNFLSSFLKNPTRKHAEYGAPDNGLSLQKIKELEQLRARLFGDQVLEGDSTRIIRDARESR
jgi:hypothetical protein